ncbi:MAG: vitamin B12-dependent ribonucleotide reductase [Synergistaceae bacterium]|jgi:ribonucleoside-diphosphate reductase alpha chain|nr:vitamin B12-dependent ribonucleotide reductase [Synergistaceae bacterium]
MTEQAEARFSENARFVLQKRYLRKDDNGEIIETPEEMLWRVAEAVSEAEGRYGEKPEDWAVKFYNIMAGLEFLPNSPTLMNAGTARGQLSACFVLPVGDSMGEIFGALSATALVHKSGGGTGFNFSRVRPAGDRVRSTSGVASGPISFMELFDHTTEVVKQGGTRRGANMGILEVSHPDIRTFIKIKRESSKLSNFNISVGLSDAFMKALENGEDWNLVNPRTGETTDSVPAAELWDMIIEGAWKSGDPGVIFLDKIEAGNMVPSCGRLDSTNPCGEQPLFPYESCNLGSINLMRMADEWGEMDWDRLERTVRVAVRFLDDVIDCNIYPMKEIDDMTRANRKIGLGIMGWAELLFARGVRYGSKSSFELAEQVMGFIQRIGHSESEALANVRGVFPNWKGSLWEERGRPMRNATVTTIAPTGTISLIADCSSGIEPVFALAFKRKAFDGDTLVYVNGFLERALAKTGGNQSAVLEAVLASGTLDGADVPRQLKEVFVTAHEIPYREHVEMQAAFQKFTDNAVSKTINLPNSAGLDDVRDSYLLAYSLGCKGITIYRDRCKDTQVLYHGADNVESSKETAKKGSSPGRVKPRMRPSHLLGSTVKIQTSFGNLYLTLNMFGGEPFELFATLGKSGKDTQAHTEALGRLISLSLRSGVPVRSIIEQLKGIGGSQPVFEKDGDGVILSLPDAIAQGLERAMGETVEIAQGDMCPSCGAPLVHAEGCMRCVSCDYSKCY